VICDVRASALRPQDRAGGPERGDKLIAETYGISSELDQDTIGFIAVLFGPTINTVAALQRGSAATQARNDDADVVKFHAAISQSNK
jgi:hypothetical protein